ncbi:hypothetical protein [Allokutzneria oryzae]|uniref:Ricin B lectin domain-containing protein n=1 Tax=Allokutzneria oryzae TaxID=1378989 RepID=A0ABV6A3I8_9PSEU
MRETCKERLSRRGIAKVLAAAVVLASASASVGLAAPASAKQRKAPVFEPGIYLVTNAERGIGDLMSGWEAGPVRTSATREVRNMNYFWEVAPSNNGGFTIKNVGANAFAGLDEVRQGEQVRTGDKPVNWIIEPTEDKGFVIALPGVDLVWNADGGAVRAPVTLRPASGEARQRWIFRSVE